MEFTIEGELGPKNFDRMDFLEFVWLHKRVCDRIKQRNKVNNAIPGR
jgi:hypothetical protein